MSPQLRMLLWKEWRERRTQFLVCLLWMVGGTAYVIAYRWSFGRPGAVIDPAIWYGVFMPVFIAMRTSLGETTDRTRSFTSGLPVSWQRLAWIRLGGGLAVLLVPIVLAAILAALCAVLGWTRLPPARAHVNILPVVAAQTRMLAVHLSSATSLYVLLSLLGTTLRREAHAGFVGTAVATLWLLGSVLVQALHYSGRPEVAAWVDVIDPGGMLITLITCGHGNERGRLYEELRILAWMLCPLLIQGIFQFAMAAWFVRRYMRRLPGRVIEAVRKAPSFLRRPRSFPLSSRSTALAWLTLRQSLPMCLPGLLIACLMTPLLVVGRFAPSAINQFHQRGELFQCFAENLPTSMSAIGLLWAVVVGAGVFSAEIDWRVGEFWRTRPIPFWRLFATKFFVGLLAVLLVLDATAIVVSWTFPDWNWGNYRGVDWPYIACIVPLHSVMFAVAVAWTCVLRRPVLGGMAAVISFALVEEIIHWSYAAALAFDPITIYDSFAHRGVAFMAHDGYPVVALAMGVILVASIMLAGFALRRYDPHRQTG